MVIPEDFVVTDMPDDWRKKEYFYYLLRVMDYHTSEQLYQRDHIVLNIGRIIYPLISYSPSEWKYRYPSYIIFTYKEIVETLESHLNIKKDEEGEMATHGGTA